MFNPPMVHSVAVGAVDDHQSQRVVAVARGDGAVAVYDVAAAAEGAKRGAKGVKAAAAGRRMPSGPPRESKHVECADDAEGVEGGGGDRGGGGASASGRLCIVTTELNGHAAAATHVYAPHLAAPGSRRFGGTVCRTKEVTEGVLEAAQGAHLSTSRSRTNARGGTQGALWRGGWRAARSRGSAAAGTWFPAATTRVCCCGTGRRRRSRCVSHCVSLTVSPTPHTFSHCVSLTVSPAVSHQEREAEGEAEVDGQDTERATSTPGVHTVAHGEKVNWLCTSADRSHAVFVADTSPQLSVYALAE
jgi:hypothetical protein